MKATGIVRKIDELGRSSGKKGMRVAEHTAENPWVSRENPRGVNRIEMRRQRIK